MEFLLLMTLGLGAFLIYFLPGIIAIKRDHPNMGPIFVIDLFLGWSLIGWVIALAWSLSSNEKSSS